MRRLLVAACAGLLLALSMPSPSVWILAWVGPALLLTAVRGLRPRRAFAVGWASGMCFAVPVLYWLAPTIVNYTSLGWANACVLVVLLCAVVASFTGVFSLVVEVLGGVGSSRVVVAPVVWVVLEWSRTFFPVAFPWAPLGSSQVGAPLEIVQAADLFGVYGISAAMMVVNAAIAELVAPRAAGWLGGTAHAARTTNRRPSTSRASLFLIVATPVVLFAYGRLRIATLEAMPIDASLQVGIVQANVSQDEKWNPVFQDDILGRYLDLSRRVAQAGARLVVWPEASVPFFLEHDPRRSRLVDLSAETGATLLVGAPGFRRERDGVRQYNQAWLITPESGLTAVYDKIRLVPFGEYVPFGALLSWVHKAVEAVADFGQGSRAVVFKGPPLERRRGSGRLRFSSLICYEGIFPGLTRRFVAAGAELLVNISNDAWYGRSSAPYQHLAMVSLRAIENRVPIVRATNTGISAFIDATGRIHDRTELFTQEAVVAMVTLRNVRSVYAHVGNWFVAACIVLLVLLTAKGFLVAHGVLNRPQGRGILPES